tara:strand:+ start:251 stop:535 length:285 start_codon:yes stop_codon:yes gene_type:complete
MAQKLSQVYDVDNRFKEAKGVADNTAGKRFLQEFRARDRSLSKDSVENSRRSDDRFVVAAEGGTIPISSLGLGSQISDTDSKVSFRNLFRAAQS